MKTKALITGGTHGIGYELAKQFAENGYDLILVARHLNTLKSVASELEKTYRTNVSTLVCDLSEPKAAAQLFSLIKKMKWKVDVLVNNAGFGVFGSFLENDREQAVSMIHLNIIALTELTKYFLPDMVQRGSGKILNVASVAGFMPGPFSAVYFATKAYVLSFSEALANELQGTGVSVSILCPGATSTGFEARANGETTRLFEGASVTSAEYVARRGFEGLKNGKRIIIPGWLNKVEIFLLRLAPRNFVTSVLRWILRK